MSNPVIRLFKTLPSPCGYYAGRLEQDLLIDPAAPNLAHVYPQALVNGFRRSGSALYRPDCPGCHACVACRIPLDGFHADRSQQRCHRRNADLAMSVIPALDVLPEGNAERHALFLRYLASRHADGGMPPGTLEEFGHFAGAAWSDTAFLDFRLDDRLVACAITDRCSTGLSAVYTFYDPDLPERGLGTFAILSQLALARDMAVPHVYLGYWLQDHPKMDYKRRFHGLELFREGRWLPFDDAASPA